MPLPASLSDHLSKLNHRHVVSSTSTNSELINTIQLGTLNANEPHLLTADTQTAGRGQHERSWQSPHGNVYLSLYHPIQTPVSGLLSLVIGVELAKMPVIQTLNQSLRTQGLKPIGVKWANDLGFYQHQSQQAADEPVIPFNKIAGILIEPVWQAGKLVGIVMGVGLNVQTTPKLTTQTCEGMSYQALSLQDIYKLTIQKQEQEQEQEQEQDGTGLPSLQELYQQISNALVAAVICFKQLALEKSTMQTYHTEDFSRQFKSMDALAGLRLRVTQSHNGEVHILNGHACGIDTNGCLQLRQDNGNISTLFTGRIDVINNV